MNLTLGFKVLNCTLITITNVVDKQYDQKAQVSNQKCDISVCVCVWGGGGDKTMTSFFEQFSDRIKHVSSQQ